MKKVKTNLAYFRATVTPLLRCILRAIVTPPLTISVPLKPVTTQPPHQIMEGDTNGEAAAENEGKSEAGDSGIIEEISPKPPQQMSTTAFIFPPNLALQPLTGEILHLPLQNVGTTQTVTFATPTISGTQFRHILPKAVKDLDKPSTSHTPTGESPSGASRSRTTSRDRKGKRARDSSSSSDGDKENRTRDPDFHPPRERRSKSKKTEKRTRV